MIKVFLFLTLLNSTPVLADFYIKPAAVVNLGQYQIGADKLDDGKAGTLGGSLQIAWGPGKFLFFGLEIIAGAIKLVSEKEVSVADRESYPIPLYYYKAGLLLGANLTSQAQMFLGYTPLDDSRADKIGSSNYSFTYKGSTLRGGLDYKFSGSSFFMGLEYNFQMYTKYTSTNPLGTTTNSELAKYLNISTFGFRLGIEL